jgi:PhoH-like ATPase
MTKRTSAAATKKPSETMKKASSATKKAKVNKVIDRKIFVLDSSAILHDLNTLMNFSEHDVAVPISVLEELDNFKKGNDTINFTAREFIRFIDELSGLHTLSDWIPLGEGRGKLKVILEEHSQTNAQEIFGDHKADHRILDAALNLHEEFPERKVILVSKDINLRVKAKSLDMLAEDYKTGQVKDLETLYKGKSYNEEISEEVVAELYKEGKIDRRKVFDKTPTPNQYFVINNHSSSVLCYYNPRTDVIELVEKTNCYGIKPRNAEQTFALHAIANPEVKLLTIQGMAGTGKTLLALAGALEQRREFHQIFLARPIIPLSNKDIGYLPGNAKAKIDPYMEPLWDNLKFIQNQFSDRTKDYHRINDMVANEKLLITPLAYIRGRSLSNILFIIDEAQNLTPHEVKTIITRAGENVKIIFTGDIYQIDSPYLDSRSNGLSYLIDKLKGESVYAHITLEKGERSELANIANKLL